MGATTLNDVMERRFHELKNNFKRASAKNNITFNEDIFIDTYIKCCDYLTDTDMNETQIIQYFWVSFVNNTKKEYRKKQYKVEKVEIEEAEYVLDEPYDNRRTFIYETIIDNVKNKFNKNEFESWFLHFTENKSYEELTQMGYININFHNVFRNINNYIKNKLAKENNEYKTIINEIFK